MSLADALLRQEPLLIQPALLAEFAERCRRYESRLEELLGQRPAPSFCEGVAVIPIQGIIGRGLAPIEKALGACDTSEVSEWIEAAASNPEVRAILFDIDSPGGTITGVPELAEQVAALRKPSASFTAGLAASAAYWIGSRADAFFTTPSASVGGVGAFLPFLDSSAAFTREGLQVEVIRSGPFKGMGLPGTSLSEAHRAHLQQRVDRAHGMFATAVRDKRRFADPDAMQGQVFYGLDALERGLATGVFPNRSAALRRLTAAL